jgi:hypothetical protein
MIKLTAALTLLPLLATPALAETAPQQKAPASVDMTTLLHDMTGKPFPDPTAATPADPGCAKCGPLTLGTAIAVSLCGSQPGDLPSETSLAKAVRCTLGMSLMGNTKAVVTASQVVTIEGHLGNWSPGVIARIIPLIDPSQTLTNPP